MLRTLLLYLGGNLEEPRARRSPRYYFYFIDSVEMIGQIDATFRTLQSMPCEHVWD